MSTPSFDTIPAPMGGVLLGDTYLLGRRIGRGGMSETFEATHARLPGRFAVKLLAPELASDREAFARFCREAEIMSELRHPNLVQIFDFNTAPDNRPYFVMELLEGRDLETRLAESGPMPLPATVRVVEAAASALAAAHAHGIVHRDLKPANIFLVAVDGQPDELVKVLDFGISKIRSAATLLSTPTAMVGSPPYLSPEQVRGATDQIDERTDQFALGAIAYRMLTGHDAFSGPDVSTLLHQIVHEAPQPLAHHLPVSWDTRALQAVLDRALAKDPADRWAGMMELARAFEAAAEQTQSRTIHQATSVQDSSAPAAIDAPAVRQGPAELVPTVGEAIRPLPDVDPAYDFAETDSPRTLDRIPVTHHRVATLGFLIVIAAVFLIATGRYRQLPAQLPRVRQTLVAWLGPKPVANSQPVAAPQPVAPPQPVAAPQPVAPPAPVAAATETVPTPLPSPAAAEPAAQAPPPENVAAPVAPETAAVVAPRHPHRAATAARFRGHPGSIELAAPAPENPPAAAAEPSAPSAPSGFSIAPPANLPDTPAHDLVPAPGPGAPPSAPAPGAATSP